MMNVLLIYVVFYFHMFCFSICPFIDISFPQHCQRFVFCYYSPRCMLVNNTTHCLKLASSFVGQYQNILSFYCSWNSPHNTCAACRQFGVIFTKNSFKIYKNFTTLPWRLPSWVGWSGRMKRTENALLVVVLS